MSEIKTTTLPGSGNPHCVELWSNAHTHQININYWIPGLRSQIQGIKSCVEEDTPESAMCDVAQQIVTEIENANNKPLVDVGPPPPMPG